MMLFFIFMTSFVGFVADRCPTNNYRGWGKNSRLRNTRKASWPLAQRGALFKGNPGVIESLHSSRYRFIFSFAFPALFSFFFFFHFFLPVLVFPIPSFLYCSFFLRLYTTQVPLACTWCSTVHLFYFLLDVIRHFILSQVRDTSFLMSF